MVMVMVIVVWSPPWGFGGFEGEQKLWEILAVEDQRTPPTSPQIQTWTISILSSTETVPVSLSISPWPSPAKHPRLSC
jgi:hypothetical protein